MKRQQHANLSWFNFDLSSADETFTISKASLIQESMFALSQEKASLYRPFQIEGCYVSFQNQSYIGRSSSSTMSSILGLISASSCRHPRMRARSTPFVTLATCSQRLSGSGSSRMQISQRRTPKLYTSTCARKENNNEKLKMHERASQFKLIYFYLSFPSSFFFFFFCFSSLLTSEEYCLIAIQASHSFQLCEGREIGSTSLSWFKLSFS